MKIRIDKTNNNLTLVSAGGHDIFVRAERQNQDMHVINEVIRGDCYGFKKMAPFFRPDTIVDFGGHIGTFSLLAAKTWPEAKIITIEPNRRSFEVLSANLRQFGTRITKINAAISYSDNIRLVDHDAATGGGFIVSQDWQNTGGYTALEYDVKPITVEQVVAMAGGKIDLTKWDCEGGEIVAFKNMTDESAKAFGRMVGEYHYPAEEFIALLSGRFRGREFKVHHGRDPIGYFSVEAPQEASA